MSPFCWNKIRSGFNRRELERNLNLIRFSRKKHPKVSSNLTLLCVLIEF